jgi:hypothetical protein
MANPIFKKSLNINDNSLLLSFELKINPIINKTILYRIFFKINGLL